MGPIWRLSVGTFSALEAGRIGDVRFPTGVGWSEDGSLCRLLQTSPESRVVGPWTRPGEGRRLDSTNWQHASLTVPFK